MEEMNEETPAPVKKTGCHNCSNPETEPGYLTSLCRECRKRFSRYPVLNSVKWAAAGVALLFLISGYNLPRYFKAGVTYQRAIKAEKSHHFVTEKRLLEQVLQQFPDNFEAGVHYTIASFNNDDLETADSMMRLLNGRNDDNEELIRQANAVMDGIQYFYIADTSFANSLAQMDPALPAYEKALDSFYHKHPNDACAAFLLGRAAYAHKDYVRADTIWSKLIQEKPDFRIAMIYLAGAYREEKQYDKSLKMCNTVLKQNAEHYYALAAAAKTLLKQKQDKEALEKAKLAYELQPGISSTAYVLVLANHYNNRPKERDQLYEAMKSFPDRDSSDIADLAGFISGKTSYR